MVADYVFALILIISDVRDAWVRDAIREGRALLTFALRSTNLTGPSQAVPLVVWSWMLRRAVLL